MFKSDLKFLEWCINRKRLEINKLKKRKRISYGGKTEKGCKSIWECLFRIRLMLYIPLIVMTPLYYVLSDWTRYPFECVLDNSLIMINWLIYAKPASPYLIYRIGRDILFCFVRLYLNLYWDEFSSITPTWILKRFIRSN